MANAAKAQSIVATRRVRPNVSNPEKGMNTKAFWALQAQHLASKIPNLRKTVDDKLRRSYWERMDAYDELFQAEGTIIKLAALIEMRLILEARRA